MHLYTYIDKHRIEKNFKFELLCNTIYGCRDNRRSVFWWENKKEIII